MLLHPKNKKARLCKKRQQNLLSHKICSYDKRFLLVNNNIEFNLL